MLFLMFVQRMFQFGAKGGKWVGYYGKKNYLDMSFREPKKKLLAKFHCPNNDNENYSESLEALLYKIAFFNIDEKLVLKSKISLAGILDTDLKT